jgi:hypothetical protein
MPLSNSIISIKGVLQTLFQSPAGKNRNNSPQKPQIKSKNDRITGLTGTLV